MNKLPWLKPIVSIVAAVALGAGLFLLGSSFVPHEQVPVAAGTQTVPVAAPIAIGDEPVPAADEVEQSTVIGDREVQLPGAARDEPDPAVVELIDALADTPDPATELVTLYGDDSGDGDPESGDACAPRDGEPSGDCPDGLRSTILPLIHPRDFVAGVEVFPPGGRYGSYLEACDAATLNPTDGSIPMGIVATAPASYSLELRKTADPGALPIVVPITTPDDQRSAWNSTLATAVSADELPQMRFCFTVAGLDDDTAYTGILSGVADDGRFSRPDTFRFHTSGDPVHPSLQLVPVGDSLLFASALHNRDETVDIRSRVVEAGAEPSCDAGAELSPAVWSDTEITEEQLHLRNLQPGNTQQHAETFRVSPGSTVIVCARWFDSAADARSWERVQPIFESTAIAQSPDRLVPSLEIIGWHDGSASPLQRVELTSATAEGSGCSSVWWTADSPVHVPSSLCRASFLHASGVRVEGDRVWDLGFSGDLVVRGRVELDSGFSEADLLIPMVDGDCRGVCSVPDPRTYRMRMAGVSIDIRQSFEPGGGNGRETWGVTPTTDVAPEYVRPDAPQLDLDREWTYSEPRPGQPYVDAVFPLVVDRPVDYVARISFTPGVSYPNCDGSGLLEARGRFPGGSSPVTVRIPKVCLGLFAESQIELVDDDGNRSVWGFVDRDYWWGPNALIQTPTYHAELTYRLNAWGEPHSRVQQLQLAVAGSDAGAENARGGLCSPDGIVSDSGTFEADLPARPIVRFRIQVLPVSGWTETDCDDIWEYRSAQLVEQEIDLRDLYGPEGAVVRIDGEVDAEIVLRAVR